MGSELHPMSLDFANSRQAENLESATVGQDGSRPIDEGVQAAGSTDNVHAGANVEMIGVTQNYLCAHFAQFARVERLDTALRAHGHEDGRIHNAMSCGQTAHARF